MLDLLIVIETRPMVRLSITGGPWPLTAMLYIVCTASTIICTDKLAIMTARMMTATGSSRFRPRVGKSITKDLKVGRN